MDEQQVPQEEPLKLRVQKLQQKQAAGDLVAAIQGYRELLEKDPKNSQIMHYLGLAYYQNKEIELAIPLLEKAIALWPDYLPFRQNSVIVYKNLNLYNLAARDLQFCLKKNPDDIQIKKALLEIYLEQEKNFHTISLMGIENFFQGLSPKQALQRYQTFIKAQPTVSALYFELGYYYYSHGDLNIAANFYRKAIEYKWEYPSAHWNLSLCLLALGDFKAGWPEYEWRFLSNAYTAQRDSTLLLDDRYQRWQGESLKNKTILVITEQGRGDAIQFIRFLPKIKQKNTRIILQARAELIPLFKNMPCIDDFCIDLQDIPVCDYYLPLMSLPYLFKITEKDLLKDNKPYLHSIVHVAIPEAKRKFKVGIVHRGSKYHTYDTARSVPWSLFSRILTNTDIQFYSFQRDERDEIQNFSADNFFDLSDLLIDFEYTAAMVMQMDLIICVDTAIAHLAGALGKPVWILNSFISDWRWMRDRIDSPWYPTAKLYRQTTKGKWDNVIEQVCDDLAAWCKVD